MIARVFISGLLLLPLTAVLRGGAAPSREAAAALAPYAMWVGRLPATEDATWAERKALADLRARLGAWLEAEYQVRAVRATPLRHAELCVQLARAARSNEDWVRADKWFATARESLDRVPVAERPFDLIADFYDEAVALREVTDVRVPYAAMTPFLSAASARGANVKIQLRLVDLALVARDEEGYTKLATALLTTARAWTRDAPATDAGPSEADRVLSAFLANLITRGYAATAAPLIESGIADAGLRQTLSRAAQAAVVAKQDDVAITTLLADKTSLAERDAIVFDTEAGHAGLVTWLARANRAEPAQRLLAGERDREFGAADGEARSQHERKWNAAVLRAAAEHLRAGRSVEVARLGELFTGSRQGDEAALIDRREGLIGFATWLGEHGQTAEAQHLLESLPPDYPSNDEPAEVAEQYRAMRADTADAVLQQKRVALALAWATAGDTARAAEVMKQLPSEDRTGSTHWAVTRQRILGAIAAAAAIHGDIDLATRLTDDAREAHDVAHQTSETEALALVPALILSGRHEDAWEEMADLVGAAPDAIIAQIVPALLARKSGNRVLEWISAAPEVHRRAAWHAFFPATAPEPDVLPVRGG